MSRPGSDRSMQGTWTPSAIVALALVVLLATGGVAVAAAGTGAGGSPWNSVDGGFAAQEVDADQVSLRADVTESGEAHWRIEYRVRLDTEDRKAAFSDLEQDVEANESDYIARFRTRMNATVTNAEETTGREMAIEDVQVSTNRQMITEEYGILAYEFRWTGFAVVEDDRLLFGDALAGFFLDEGQSLTLTWPDAYELESVRPAPDETGANRVRWSGETDFASDEPRVVVTRSGVGISGLLVAGLLAAIIVIALVVWRRDAVAAAVGVGVGGADGGPTEGEAGEAAGTGADVAAEDTAAEGTGAPSAPPEELLSNEERVIRLLEEHGGRMKQQDIVQELDWTDARTSQVVSELRDEGKIEGFRLGRENVLRLPEADELAPGESEAESGNQTGSDETSGGEREDESDVAADSEAGSDEDDEQYGYQG